MTDAGRYRVVQVQAHDTGIGRAAGYEDDAALLAAGDELWESMPPEMRRIISAIEDLVERRMMLGDDHRG